MVKKRKFVVIIDEYGKKKKYLLKLLSLLRREYSFLKEAPCWVTTKQLKAAKKGDVIIFGFSKRYDFRILSSSSWKQYRVNRRIPVVELYYDWKEVKNLLEEYVDKNYPEEEQQSHYCCIWDDYIYVDNNRNWENIYIIPKKKKRVQKPKKGKLYLDDVEVHHNYVRVGYDVYDIWLNKDKDEYVEVDGNVYWIDRDSYGNGKLSVE